MSTPATHGGAAPPPEPAAAGAPEPAEPPPAAVVDELEPAPPGALQRAAPAAPPAAPGGPDELQHLWRLGRMLALAEYGDNLTQAMQATAALRYFLATDLDLPLNAALEIHLIDGRPYFSARLLRILAIRHGYRIIPGPGSGDETCTAILLEDATGKELGQATYTMADAERAGLAERNNYRKHPGPMLWARAARRVLDYYAPNVLFGLRVPSDPLTLAKAGNAMADLELDSDELEGDEAIPF